MGTTGQFFLILLLQGACRICQNFFIIYLQRTEERHFHASSLFTWLNKKAFIPCVILKARSWLLKSWHIMKPKGFSIIRRPSVRPTHMHSPFSRPQVCQELLLLFPKVIPFWLGEACKQAIIGGLICVHCCACIHRLRLLWIMLHWFHYNNVSLHTAPLNFCIRWTSKRLLLLRGFSCSLSRDYYLLLCYKLVAIFM